MLLAISGPGLRTFSRAAQTMQSRTTGTAQCAARWRVGCSGHHLSRLHVGFRVFTLTELLPSKRKESLHIDRAPSLQEKGESAATEALGAHVSWHFSDKADFDSRTGRQAFHSVKSCSMSVQSHKPGTRSCSGSSSCIKVCPSGAAPTTAAGLLLQAILSGRALQVSCLPGEVHPNLGLSLLLSPQLFLQQSSESCCVCLREAHFCDNSCCAG